MSKGSFGHFSITGFLKLPRGITAKEEEEEEGADWAEEDAGTRLSQDRLEALPPNHRQRVTNPLQSHGEKPSAFHLKFGKIEKRESVEIFSNALKGG